MKAVKYIPLAGESGRGKYAIVDVEDYDDLVGFRWYINKSGYVWARVKGKTVYMHRMILRPDEGMTVDHKNHNTLDNRKSNIWVCSQGSNNLNRNMPELKCYHFDSCHDRWCTEVKVRGKKIKRTYRTEEEVAAAVALLKEGIVPPKKSRWTN